MTVKMKNNYILEDDAVQDGKVLPDAFASDDKLLRFCVFSVILHIVFVLAIGIASFVLQLLGINLSLLPKPELKKDDIVFLLTDVEQTPINKKTAIRSDKNSQAGGKNDPTRKVTEASPAPKAPVKQIQSSTPVQKAVSQKAQSIVKPALPVKTQTTPQKPVQQQIKEAPKAPSKPSKTLAPVQRPVIKPGVQMPKAQTPKLTNAPQSPFRVSVPQTNAPVGKGFSASNGTSSSGGVSGGTSSKGLMSSSSGGGMPAPQFSTTRTASSRTGGGTSTSSKGPGGYGVGNMGNPSPGNPKGAPGIDAIKSPQWGPYMRELESKIKRNWFPPKGDQSKRVVLLFTIGRKGELLSVRVQKPSGSEANDQAAIRAVQQSAPFRALPPEHQGSSIQIEFTFDYNVLGASYR